MLGLFALIYSGIFFINAIVILNESRFLNRIKLPLASEHRVNLGQNRQKIVDLINAAKTIFVIPLMVLNALCIVYEVFLG
ncbi:immediate early response 3-interacting protein 1 [Enteropsectra breve]|nr:immediate early response 3-interacting protein 1 [Enteropsectra breve]